MKKTTWKGGALIAPIPPVLVSCGDENKANIITVAWTGIIATVPPKTYISVRPSRHSHSIISEKREFVINLATAEQAKKVDYCGIYTGAKVDKFEKCGFTKEKSTEVGCPSIAECPLSIECRVSVVLPQGSHDMFIADIVAVNVDETLLDEKRKLELEKAGLLAFAHGEYFRLGEKVGEFGFSARKTHTPKKDKTPKGFEAFAKKNDKKEKKNDVKNARRKGGDDVGFDEDDIVFDRNGNIDWSKLPDDIDIEYIDDRNEPSHKHGGFEKGRGTSHGGRKSYGDKKPYGDRKSYGDKKPYGDRKSYGDKKSYGDRKSYGEKKSHGDKKPYGEKKFYGDKKAQFGASSGGRRTRKKY